jgi:hypothetical protein
LSVEDCVLRRVVLRILPVYPCRIVMLVSLVEAAIPVARLKDLAAVAYSPWIVV